MQPANDTTAVVPAITDALHALLAVRANAIAMPNEGSDEEAELAYHRRYRSLRGGTLAWR